MDPLSHMEHSRKSHYLNGGKIEINCCSIDALRFLPGVDGCTLRSLDRIRETDGNITPQRFARLQHSYVNRWMEMIDFSPWHPSQIVPPNVYFDGTNDWNTFISNYSKHANGQKWNTKQRRQILAGCLGGGPDEDQHSEHAEDVRSCCSDNSCDTDPHKVEKRSRTLGPLCDGLAFANHALDEVQDALDNQHTEENGYLKDDSETSETDASPSDTNHKSAVTPEMITAEIETLREQLGLGTSLQNKSVPKNKALNDIVNPCTSQKQVMTGKPITEDSSHVDTHFNQFDRRISSALDTCEQALVSLEVMKGEMQTSVEVVQSQLESAYIQGLQHCTDDCDMFTGTSSTCTTCNEHDTPTGCISVVKDNECKSSIVDDNALVPAELTIPDPESNDSACLSTASAKCIGGYIRGLPIGKQFRAEIDTSDTKMNTGNTGGTFIILHLDAQLGPCPLTIASDPEHTAWLIDSPVQIVDEPLTTGPTTYSANNSQQIPENDILNRLDTTTCIMPDQDVNLGHSFTSEVYQIMYKIMETPVTDQYVSDLVADTRGNTGSPHDKKQSVPDTRLEQDLLSYVTCTKTMETHSGPHKLENKVGKSVDELTLIMQTITDSDQIKCRMKSGCDVYHDNVGTSGLTICHPQTARPLTDEELTKCRMKSASEIGLTVSGAASSEKHPVPMITEISPDT